MCEDLKTVMQEVRRNEALIEYMELRGILPAPMHSTADVKNSIIAKIEMNGGQHA